jgi:hypothetical protein
MGSCRTGSALRFVEHTENKMLRLSHGQATLTVKVGSIGAGRLRALTVEWEPDDWARGWQTNATNPTSCSHCTGCP